MFCRNRGMQLPHIHQPVFETDGAQLYKKRAKLCADDKICEIAKAINYKLDYISSTFFLRQLPMLFLTVLQSDSYV